MARPFVIFTPNEGEPAATHSPVQLHGGSHAQELIFTEPMLCAGAVDEFGHRGSWLTDEAEAPVRYTGRSF